MTDFIDLNLKAADKAAMTKALLAAGFIKDPESGTLYHPTASLQLLPPGMVTRPTAVMDEEGLPVREPVPGYHANVRTTDAEMAAALAPVAVVVETPQYVWASDQTGM
ncbi:hypothetical protein [Aeromonas hydrophila]|uniref:hypothetical protein n=1 Tax=Aeromonas hydrophila TaxID=644 RepID=UPI000588A4CC|nr:hypothetical protein [Aeromonas hydrophila]AJE36362.1 hypothetical protein V469_11135 [Aeromonas hydrophila J-1]AKJ34621.1 hypothetical protein U876_11550 [Aeromonas hydrophila NJ-35]ALQ63466.1 hypothetical protein AS145_11450 [Aeromonas hydrophila]ALZ80137.1 hypothetical protein AhyD4_11255 [Aeromonas hydrophila]AXV30033.1 hypothetical protein BFW97_11255 [Aeromonas hydrophila]